MENKKLVKLKKDCFDHLKEVYAPEERIFVFGEGNVGSCLMLVGEAPGKDETIKQRPFVGKAGKNLDAFIDVLGLNRGKMYVTNVVKFRPVKKSEKTGRLSNRPPTKQEVNLCLPFLLKEIDLVKPQIVVSLGNTALQALTQDRHSTVGNMHGKFFDIELKSGKRILLFPLYHPASIIYNRSLREIYNQDLKKLRKVIESKST